MTKRKMHNENTHTGPSFSLKNRLGRLIWNIFYIVGFRYSPRPFHGWRAQMLRTFGADVGKGVHIYPGAKIWAPWNLKLGDRCGIADGTILYSQGLITVGKNAVVSQGAHICAGTHDYTVPGFPLQTAPIRIEDYAWIAAEVFVHPGVTISEGAVIGARSVVNSDMPAWMVCAGFPCKPIKPRIAESEIENFKASSH
ncbi:MAG: putative colanic acid biosynthesis acetyltransferase [Flavobacteriales bacterium]|nr:putative colanic acid biosynthesis acetyltransferase [Flavobacteriales bacterium]